MFGIELIDATLAPAMFVALLSGILSFLSPCILPIVPPYLAYISGISLQDMSATGAKGAQPDWGSFFLCDGAFDGLFAFGLYGLGLWALFSKPC